MVSRACGILDGCPEVIQEKATHFFPTSGQHAACKPHPLLLTRLDFLCVESHFLLQHTLAVTYGLFEEDGVSCLYVDTPQVSVSSNPPHSSAYGIELLHLMRFRYG